MASAFNLPALSHCTQAIAHHSNDLLNGYICSALFIVCVCFAFEIFCIFFLFCLFVIAFIFCSPSDTVTKYTVWFLACSHTVVLAEIEIKCHFAKCERNIHRLFIFFFQ